MGKCQGGGTWCNNTPVKEGGVPPKSLSRTRRVVVVGGFVFVPRSSLVSMSLLNIEPLSINTHMQTGPTLPRGSPWGPSHTHTHPPPWSLLPLGNHCRRRKEAERKRQRKKQRKGEKRTQNIPGEAKAEGRVAALGEKWEETADWLSDKCVRCTLQITTPLPNLSLPVYGRRLGSRPEDIPSALYAGAKNL